MEFINIVSILYYICIELIILLYTLLVISLALFKEYIVRCIACFYLCRCSWQSFNYLFRSCYFQCFTFFLFIKIKDVLFWSYFYLDWRQCRKFWFNFFRWFSCTKYCWIRPWFICWFRCWNFIWIFCCDYITFKTINNFFSCTKNKPVLFKGNLFSTVILPGLIPFNLLNKSICSLSSSSTDKFTLCISLKKQ